LNFIHVPLSFIRVPLSFIRVPLNFIRVPLNFIRVRLNFIRVRLNFIRVRLNFIDEQFIDLRREQSWMSASMNGVNELARSGEPRGYSSRPSAPRMQVIMGNSMCSARSK
jgi:hypothetical protein